MYPNFNYCLILFDFSPVAVSCPVPGSRDPSSSGSLHGDMRAAGARGASCPQRGPAEEQLPEGGGDCGP